MDLQEYINKKICSISNDQAQRIEKPRRLTFLTDSEAERRGQAEACKIWYNGNGDQILDYYTGEEISGFLKDPIYNRNKRNYFWGLSSRECDIKRVHSGIPHAIIDTLTNVVGKPQIQVNDENNLVWDEIEEFNDLYTKVVQQSRPLTLAQGYGAWKINFNKAFFDKPTWEYYDAEYIDFVFKSGVLIGIIFKSYYKDNNNKEYLLIESRYTKNHNSYIDYELFMVTGDNEVEPVDLNVITETQGIEPRTVIYGLNRILAVPSIYLYDHNVGTYGRSLFAGKLDLFDNLDEALSQAQLTLRESAPITWYSADVLERGANGETGIPNKWNRTFINYDTVPNPDGTSKHDVFVDQPQLRFDQFINLSRDILDYIATGVLSPATLGIDLSKKDNAEAQREKEKVTIMTRDNIIAKGTRIWKEIVSLSLIMQEYMSTGLITNTAYNISVTYNEFANPSFETMLERLYQVWVSGAIPTNEYVSILWGDKKSDAEIQEIVDWLDNNRQIVRDGENNFNLQEQMLGANPKRMQ